MDTYGLTSRPVFVLKVYPSHSYQDFFDKNRTGVYIMSGDYGKKLVTYYISSNIFSILILTYTLVDDLIDTMKRANEHRLDKELETRIVACRSILDKVTVYNVQLRVCQRMGRDQIMLSCLIIRLGGLFLQTFQER